MEESGESKKGSFKRVTSSRNRESFVRFSYQHMAGIEG